MGLDGGTKITRSDVLRGHSWRLTTADNSRSTRGGSISSSQLIEDKQIEKSLEKEIKWKICALSEQPLQPPLVADFLGSLYNKSAVLTLLLNRNGVFSNEEEEYAHRNLMRTSGIRFQHLQRKKDVFDIHCCLEKGAFQCPVSELDCFSRASFSALSTCGHLFSDRAIQQMTDQCCMLCSVSFKKDEIVPINSENESRMENLRKRLRSSQEKQHSKSKHSNKKRKSKPNKQDAL